MRMIIVITSVLVAVSLITASATIINVPDDYETIQEGIDASSDGDTVLVQPGTYLENINFNGHNIVLGSLFLTTGDTTYVSTTIIDGSHSDPVLTFENGETSTAQVVGFTIQNGHAVNGGGIYCYESSPTISHNKISENSADDGGSGIFCYNNSSPIIMYNTISENSFSYYGGGIYCHESSPTISNNTISRNYAGYSGGGIYCYYSNPTISNNTITGNSAYGYGGGGIYCYNYSSPTISNNTISGNRAGYDAGGICCHNYSDAVVINTILWEDTAPSEGNEIYIDSTSSISITYCDVQGGWGGEGNIDADPLFRDPDNGDFHLKADSCGDVYNSPCIDAGDPAIFDSMLGCDWGLGEERSDMGAYGGEGIPTDVDEEQTPDIPLRFLLSQNYPNPFNASTTISFSLPEARFVQLTVYDLLGREIRTLTDEFQQAGIHHITFDASDLASGFYFYRLRAGESVESRRMVLLK